MPSASAAHLRPRLFGALVLALSGQLQPARVAAQAADSSWISVSGGSDVDADTYVLLTGVIGGISGYRRVERQLVALGHNVIRIDPYLMSIDSANVSFDALARRVNAVLDARGVTTAKVVGHAHGGGVAIRLAASSPRVLEVFLLNVGALSGNKSPVFSSSVRLAPLIRRIPGGKSVLRRLIVAGIRENSGNTRWLDSAYVHAYSDPLLDNIGNVVRMALRLGDSQEPESLDTVVGRIRVPVTLLIGALTCPASPGVEELAALKPLGDLVRSYRIDGTCHFPHEEASDVVVRYLTRPRVRRSTK